MSAVRAAERSPQGGERERGRRADQPEPGRDQRSRQSGPDRGTPDLTPAHLLLALLEGQDNENITDLLAAVDADQAAVRAGAERVLAGLPSVTGSTVAPPSPTVSCSPSSRPVRARSRRRVRPGRRVPGSPATHRGAAWAGRREGRRLRKPELIDRLDDLVVFSALTKTELERIAALQLDRLGRRLAERRLTLDVTPEALAWMADEGMDPAYGARPLRRLVQTAIGDRLAKEILSGEIKDGDRVRVGPRRRGPPGGPGHGQDAVIPPRGTVSMVIEM
ncbi:hypothetical protein SHIRM173S_12656 [Streptomyces hirsutus]